MRVCYVYADMPYEKNTSVWRCFIPARAINRIDGNRAFLIHVNDFMTNTVECNAVCELSDIIIVERNFRDDALKAMAFWKAKGKTIVANFDDAYQLMNPNNVAYPYWYFGRYDVQYSDGRKETKHLKPIPLEQFKTGLKIAHAIITPSKILCEDWQKYGKAYHVPNWFEGVKYIKEPERKPGDRIVIGWGGSMSHYQSFEQSGVTRALKEVCKNNKNVAVMICGDQRILKLLRISEDQLIFQPYVSFEEWPGVLNKFDIGLAPLCGEYDQRRSWIKPLEYMLMKKPWIGSVGAAYKDIDQLGHLTNNNNLSWERMINYLIKFMAEQNEVDLRNRAYQFACNQDINLHVGEMLELFQTIINEKE
jgi:hypothetical protein